MKVRIKKLVDRAVIPTYAKPGDAAMDLTAISGENDHNGNIVYGTGLAFEIPKGYMMLLFPRSSNANKELLLSNSVGVVDSGYRGEVLFKFKDLHMGVTEAPFYKVGDRIGQAIILPYPQIEFEEVQELAESERSVNGFGSTGR